MRGQVSTFGVQVLRSRHPDGLEDPSVNQHELVPGRSQLLDDGPPDEARATDNDDFHDLEPSVVL